MVNTSVSNTDNLIGHTLDQSEYITHSPVPEAETDMLAHELTLILSWSNFTLCKKERDRGRHEMGEESEGERVVVGGEM